MEKNIEKAEQSRTRAWELLIKSVNTSTEELYASKQREINLLKQLLEKDKVITELVKSLAEKEFPSPQETV